MFSDAYACTSEGGLGGYAHGSFWHIALDEADMKLMHITAWEFLAVGVNILIYGPLFDGHEVYLLADALATVQILASNAAHSAVMQRIHDLILSLPEFDRLRPNVFSTHVYGRINILADAASRGTFNIISTICSQIGIDAVRVNIPSRVFDFLEAARQRVRSLNDPNTESVPSANVVTPRVQSREELNFMHHLGSEFIGADDQPLMFKFTPWGKRTLDTLTSETGSFDIDISNTSLSCQQQCFQPRQRTFQWGSRHAKEEVPCAPLRIQQGTSNLAGSNISPASCQTSLLKLGWGRPLIQLESNVPMGLSGRSNSSNVLASPYKSTNHTEYFTSALEAFHSDKLHQFSARSDLEPLQALFQSDFLGTAFASCFRFYWTAYCGKDTFDPYPRW